MKPYSTLLFVASALVYAQSTTTTYERDLNGRRIAVSTTSVAANGDQTRDLVGTINGSAVAREQISERVLRSDAQTKLTERVIRKFDEQGRSSGTERALIEETGGAGGSRTVKETVYRSTLNGPMLEDERRLTETHVKGDVTSTQVTVERPGVNRAFSTVERRTIVTEGTAQSRQTTETVLRPDPFGGFSVFQRRETAIATAAGKTTSDTALYDIHGGLEPTLTSRTMVTTVKEPDGSETTETNLYVSTFGARAQHAGARPGLQEQQTREKRVSADGSVTETLSVRLPVSGDPGRLGAARVVSETVCRGKCIEPAGK